MVMADILRIGKVMYQADTVNLRYLNPAFIFHNLNNRSMFNAIAHAELDIMLYRGLNLYGSLSWTRQELRTRPPSSPTHGVLWIRVFPCCRSRHSDHVAGVCLYDAVPLPP
jgi:hypothetical protein